MSEMEICIWEEKNKAIILTVKMLFESVDIKKDSGTMSGSEIACFLE